MNRRFAIIFIAIVCMTMSSAGYARQTRTGSATRAPSNNKGKTTEAGIGQISPLALVGGSGSQGTIPLWVSSTSLGNSTLNLDLFNNLGINGNAYPQTEVTINAGQDSGLKILSSGTDGINVKGGTDGLYAEATTFGVVAIGNTGVSGSGSQGPGVRGTSGASYGIRGHSNKTYGIYGTSDGGFAAILGEGTFNNGILGTSDSAKGVWGISASGAGVQGQSSTGFAGKFSGKVSIVSNGSNPGDLAIEGMLSKGGGSFKIDHPLDPENKYLYHSFVESPDMMNIYNGNIVTNENGEAIVIMPDYFEALNTEFRYQLTVIGTFAQAIVGEKIKGNRFVIKTSEPNVEVSWQVTGVRHDAFANKNRIKVEVEKEGSERGFYLHPDAFNQSPQRGIEWARNSEMRQQMKGRRGM